MAVDLGKNLISSFLGLTGTRSVNASKAVVASKAYKTAGYATIPYENAPVITDTVPTKNSDGTPLLAGYNTPNRVWVA